MLMVMFLATLLLSAHRGGSLCPHERQREKEQELIWRGKQYVRGIKLYYRKTGRFLLRWTI